MNVKLKAPPAAAMAANRSEFARLPEVHAVRLVRQESFHDKPELRAEWSALSLRTKGDFFGSFDWCEAWWRHYGKGRTLRLCLLYDGADLVAVVPLFQETLAWGPCRVRVVRLLGCDFVVTTCSFLVDPHYVRPVARELASELARAEWDVAQLGELPGYFDGAAEFAQALGHAQWTVEYRGDTYPHMVVDIPPSFATYMSKLRATERHNILKRERRLRARHRLRFEIASPPDVQRGFEAFVRQHQEQWQAAGKLGHFADWAGSLDFHRELVAQQAPLRRLMLMQISVDEQPIAYQYCYVYNGRVHFIIGSRALSEKWQYFSPGRLLHCAVVKAAIERNAYMLDSLGGYFDHKRRLGARVLGLQTITLRRRARASAVRLRVFQLITRAVDAVYHRAWYWHLGPSLRRRFGALCPYVAYRGLWPRFVRARFLVVAKRVGRTRASTA